MEVMIAITVLAFITIAIVTIQDNSRATKSRVVEEDKDWLQVETAFSRFAWDISQIYSPLYFSHEMRVDIFALDFVQLAQSKTQNGAINNAKFNKVSYEGLPIPEINYSDKNSIEFFTTSNRRKIREMKQSHFAWVKYSLEKDEDAADNSKSANMWIRRFNANDPFNPNGFEWEDIKAQVLLRNVKSLKLEYWSPERKKWVDNPDLVKEGKYILRGIKATLEWVNRNGFEETFVRVYRPNFPMFKAEDMYDLMKPLEVTGTPPP